METALETHAKVVWMSSSLNPRTAAIKLDRMLPQDRNVVYDGGNFLLVAPYVSVPSPAHVKQSSDFSSIAREGIALVIAVRNDCAYGAELHHLKLRDGPVDTTILPDIDFAPVAEKFGLQAVTIRTLNELRALAPLLAAPWPTADRLQDQQQRGCRIPRRNRPEIEGSAGVQKLTKTDWHLVRANQSGAKKAPGLMMVGFECAPPCAGSP